MRNPEFVRYSAVLLGLVVLCTKTRNRFCPMCTKECCIVLTRSKPFWGQFWGQICETDSDSQRSNKCAALVSLRNMNTSSTGFLPVKSPTNPYISFTLQQEVVRKPTLHHPRTPPLSPRETLLFGRIQTASTRCLSSQIPPQIPRLGGFLSKNGFSCAGFAQTGFTCTGKACTNKLNTKKANTNPILSAKRKIRIFML